MSDALNILKDLVREKFSEHEQCKVQLSGAETTLRACQLRVDQTGRELAQLRQDICAIEANRKAVPAAPEPQAVEIPEGTPKSPLLSSIDCALDMARELARMTGTPIPHFSDCALHNGPALEPGPCSCGAEPGLTPSDYEARVKQTSGSHLVADFGQPIARLAADGERIYAVLADGTTRDVTPQSDPSDQPQHREEGGA